MVLRGVGVMREAAAVPDADGGSPGIPRRTATALVIITVLATASTTAWVAAVLLTVGHGFDATDEGFYLLMYRWWDVGADNLTAVQYCYGPIFALLGHSIPALRVFRLLTVLATHATFGWAFMTWLRTRRPNAPATLWWEIAGTTVVVASGGMIYSFLALSPGYDDVSVLAALLAAAIVLRVAADVERGLVTPAWVLAALGPVDVVMLLARWSSAVLTIALVSLVGILAARRRSWREVRRLVAWAAGGVLGTAVLAQLFVVPLASIVPGIVAVNETVAASTHGPSHLLAAYLDSSGLAIQEVLKEFGVLHVAAVFATLASGRFWRGVALVLVVVGLALSVRQIVIHGDLVGGADNLNRYPIAVMGLLFAPVVIAVAALMRDRLTRSTVAAEIGSLIRPGGRSGAVLAMLGLLPVTQAAGTSNALHWMAMNALAAWAAAIIVILTGIEAAPATVRWLAGAATAGVLAVTTCVAIGGVWVHPYRTLGRDRTTESVVGVPALSGLRVDSTTARAYADLHERLRPWIEPPGRAIMAFDDMPGLVFMLDGRSVGEAWYSSLDPDRTAITTRAACRETQRLDERVPILLFNRPVSDVEVGTLRVCGYDFAHDYRLLAPRDQTYGLAVYVPADG